MSATTGTGDLAAIAASASASSERGQATRTMSTPAALSAAICCKVALTSCVGVSVIDCTLIGASPPTMTPPTLMARERRRLGGVRCSGCGRWAAPVLRTGSEVRTARRLLRADEVGSASLAVRGAGYCCSRSEAGLTMSTYRAVSDSTTKNTMTARATGVMTDGSSRHVAARPRSRRTPLTTCSMTRTAR